jgi:hypothetical protein
MTRIRAGRKTCRDSKVAYQQCLAIMKRVDEQDKANSGWQRDLAVSYNKAGGVLDYPHNPFCDWYSYA